MHATHAPCICQGLGASLDWRPGLIGGKDLCANNKKQLKGLSCPLAAMTLVEQLEHRQQQGCIPKLEGWSHISHNMHPRQGCTLHQTKQNKNDWPRLVIARVWPWQLSG
jgi:hypothetical protein